jgi:hypothetical protein
MDLPVMRRKGSTNRQGSLPFEDKETQFEMEMYSEAIVYARSAMLN